MSARPFRDEFADDPSEPTTECSKKVIEGREMRPSISPDWDIRFLERLGAQTASGGTSSRPNDEGLWLEFTRWSRGLLADRHLQGPNALIMHRLDHLLSLVLSDYRGLPTARWIGHQQAA